MSFYRACNDDAISGDDGDYWNELHHGSRFHDLAIFGDSDDYFAMNYDHHLSRKLSCEDEIKEDLQKRCDLSEESSESLAKRCMIFDDEELDSASLFEPIKQIKDASASRDDGTSSVHSKETQETTSSITTTPTQSLPKRKSMNDQPTRGSPKSDRLKKPQFLKLSKDLEGGLVQFICDVQQASFRTVINLRPIKRIYARNQQNLIPKYVWLSINSMLTGESLRESLQKGKLEFLSYLAKPTPMFFDKDGNVFDSYTVTGCEEMSKLIDLIKMTPKQRSKEVNLMKYKSKDLTGDILHPCMRCPQYSNTNGKLYINSRDDLSRKHIMSGCLELMSIKLCQISAAKSENMYQSVTDVMRRDIKNQGRVQDPQNSRIFKEVFFRHYVGRKPEGYQRVLEKEKIRNGVVQSQEAREEHEDLFNVKDAMFEGCLRHLFKNCQPFRKIFMEVLESDELLDHLDCKTRVGIDKLFESDDFKEYPYSRTQNQLAIAQFMIFFDDSKRKSR